MRKERLREAASQGISLPIVVCAGALLLAFALAFVYTASLMMANANRKLDEERCYQLAKSFSQVLGAELEKTPAQSEFRKFADQFLDDERYVEYDPDAPESIYYYALQEQPPEGYGNLRVRLRKELNTDAESMEGTLPVEMENGGIADYTRTIENLREIEFNRYILTVDAVAERDDLSYVYSSEYYRRDQYDVVFAYEGETIVWDSAEKNWKYGNTAGRIVNFPDEDAVIEYSYAVDAARASAYLALREEKEQGSE